MDTADVLLAIEKGELDSDIDPIATRARDRSVVTKRRSLKVGSTVSFEAKGRVFEGTVTKINPKTVAVDCFNGPRYRVPPAMLTVK